MTNRLARKPLIIAWLCALGVMALPAGASARLLAGVSDNNPAMFSEPAFLRLHVKIARDMVPWNAAVMRNKATLRAARDWIRDAKAAHVQPMISFSADPGTAGNHVPGVREYTHAVRAFLRDFPSVKTYTPWNEPDFVYRSLARNPRLAAAYFNVLVRYCHHCTIVAGDVYRPANDGLASWVRAYERGLHHRPVAWALHPYDDVRSHTTSQIRALEQVTRGQIWLDEISGVEVRGHWPWGNQSPQGAGRDERFLFSLPKRFHRITRIYHYQWQATPGYWDSALLGPKGGRRPAYYTFARAVHGRLP